MMRLFFRLSGALVVLLAGLLVVLVLLGRYSERFRVSDWRVVLNAVIGLAAPAVDAGSLQQGFVLPDGLEIVVYAQDLPNARTLRLTPGGDLLVSQPRKNQVSLLGKDADGDGQPDSRRVLLADLDRPYGLDFLDGWLYVAEAGAVGRIRFDSATGTTSGRYQHVLDGLPTGGNHWTRTLRVGSDGWLYLSLGSSCNVCKETHPWRAAMIRLRPDGSGAELYANGLRNSVGFDWAPWSGELFATDNGRDLLGDNFPPDELNRIVRGGFYGWPHRNGVGVVDPDFPDADAALLARAIAPAHAFAAHNAPLGMSFLRSEAMRARFGRAAVVALHGSWNRSTPDGYKLALLQWDDRGVIRQSDFLRGFERQGKVLGRPADIVEAGDGSLFVSDDYAGVVYRIQAASDASGVAGAPTASALNPAASGSGVAALPTPALRDPQLALAGIADSEKTRADATAAQLLTQYGCASCHVPGSALGEKWATLGTRYSLTELSAFFLAPTPPMPLFPLNDVQRRALAIHLLGRAARATP